MAALKIAQPQMGRHVLGPLDRVDGAAGKRDDPGVDVGAVDAPAIIDAELFGQHHGGGVGLFPGGAGGGPDPQRLAASGKQLFGMVLEPAEVLGFAKEIGLVGGEQVDGELPLVGITGLIDPLPVGVIAGEVQRPQPLGEPGLHQRPLAGGKIDAGRIQDEAAKQIELALAESRGEFGGEGGRHHGQPPCSGENCCSVAASAMALSSAMERALCMSSRMANC